MRVTVEPGPLTGAIPALPEIAPPAAARSWQRRALGRTLRISVRVAEHLVLLMLLAPVILLLGGLVVACTIAVLAPFVALPVLHATFPWPTLLTDGLASLGVQNPRLVPAIMAGLAWLGLSSATMLLVLGFRWPESTV